MHVLKGYLFAFVVAVCLSYGLTFLPAHSLRLALLLPVDSQSVSSNMLERSLRELSTIRIHGRIEQIERHGDGIAVQVSTDQRRLDEMCLLDAYSIIFQLMERANVASVQVSYIHLQSDSNLGTVTARSGDLTNPLPKSDEIADYVKRHFSVQYNN